MPSGPAGATSMMTTEGRPTVAFDAKTLIARAIANQNPAPSRRQVKDRSGRSSRRAANSRRTLAAVGGFADDVKAMYAPADTEMCRVVPDSVGWLPDGRPRRF